VTAGVPAQVAAADGGGALWLLEERLRGRHIEPQAVGAWWDAAVAWVTTLAAAPSRPLRETTWWEATLRDGPAAVADRWRGTVRAALEQAGDLRAVPLHGDVQPKNLLLLEDGGIGAVDWETALPEALPGLDLLFLALMADGEPPRAEVLVALASGNEPSPGRLLDALAQVGVSRELLPAVVVAATARWAADEALRARTLGVAPQPPRYARLMDIVGPTVAAELDGAA
jgi:hypothetical protein